jgi:hypothetical protein
LNESWLFHSINGQNRRMNPPGKLTLLALLLAAPASVCFAQARGGAAAERPAVAYTQGGTLYLASESGQVVKKIGAPVPIGDFAISPDLKTVIFASAVPGVVGGPFLIMDTASGKIDPMMPDPYFNDASVGGDLAEFYSDPEFSQDGKLVLFAAHAAGLGSEVHTSGPLAILNLATREVSIVKSTVASDGLPYGHMRNPHWSPDGKQILGNIEGRAFVAEVDGQTLNEAKIPESEISQSGSSYGMHAIGWLGGECVLYQAGETPDRDPARVLQLRTQMTSPAAEMLHISEDNLRGLRDLAGGLRIVSVPEGYRVEGPAGNWLIRGDREEIFTRLLPVRAGATQIPAECR